MIELNINDMKDTERHSSKGNQLKWNPANTETWYKADYIGYEGLTEYMVSHLLMHSTLSTKDFVLYDTEILRVGKKDYLGCKSSNFLPDGWQLLTLERLFHTLHGKSLYQSIFQNSFLSICHILGIPIRQCLYKRHIDKLDFSISSFY